MATTTLPQQRTNMHLSRWIIAAIILVIIIGAVLLLLNRTRNSRSTTAIATSSVTSATIIASVAGSGSVAAAQSLNLAFQSSGIVTNVFVKNGDLVHTDQALAQLDTRQLQLQLDQAQANLTAAQAQLLQVQHGSATAGDIQSAKAQLTSAIAQLAQTKTGSATAADIQSAKAQLGAAQAQLNALKNPTMVTISAAERQVQQAQLALQNSHNTTSQAKTNGELALQNAVNALTQAQSKYATAKADWEFVQSTGQDPTNPSTTNATTGKKSANRLNDAQTQQYYDTFIQADAALKSAENAVTQAQVGYEQARQTEVIQVQQAESSLADAQAQLTALSHPSASALAQSQAAVIQAQASLANLQKGATAAAIAQAQAAVAQAQANLDGLTAPATESALATAQANALQAQVALESAQANLDQATLHAPFAGVVSLVGIVPGSSSTNTNSSSAMSLLDRSTLHVDLTLSENDVAKVALGQKVALAIDALKGWAANGVVDYIAPAATTTNGVVTYAVRVSFPGTDDRVKVGMTANLIITTATHANVLVIPASALLPKGSGYAVKLLNNDAKTTREVDVTIGLSDGINTEIVSGLKAGDQVVTTVSAATTPAQRGGFFGGG